MTTKTNIVPGMFLLAPRGYYPDGTARPLQEIKVLSVEGGAVRFQWTESGRIETTAERVAERWSSDFGGLSE